MGKVISLLAVSVLVLAGALSPWRLSMPAVRAASPSVSCAATPSTAPMQGHFTGPWHSDGDYHFHVFNTDLDLKIIIDGTIDATVTPDGQISAIAQGKVDAPITHDGQRDVSSGYGTIKGILSGILNAGSATLVLSHPIIDMQWGTFVAGGYTVERFITMPDYQFPISTSGCVTAGGTISESGFPVMNLVADGQGQLTQAPGVGNATGTWTLTSDKAQMFGQLSNEVEGFTAHADAVLGDSATPLTPSTVQAQILAPLQDLRSRISAEPAVARCLLDRLSAWQARALPPLFRRAILPAGPISVPLLRGAADTLRSAASLNLDCAVPDGGAADALTATGGAMLDRAIAARSWSDTALVLRELLLLGGNGARASLTSRMNGDLHGLIAGTADTSALLDEARAAYALGDDVDAAAATTRLRPHLAPASHPAPAQHRKRKKKRKPAAGPTATPKPARKVRPMPKPTTTPTPKPTSTPTPTATSTPRPKTLAETVAAGIPAARTSTPAGTPPSFSWQPVAGAVSYVVIVTSPKGHGVIWTWSGSDTTATFGDTAIPGVPGTESDGWTAALPDGYGWSVLALDGAGKIMAAAFR